MFDIKFLLKSYPDLVFPSAHVDLRFLARRVALTGGQKSIEDELGLAEGDPRCQRFRGGCTLV